MGILYNLEAKIPNADCEIQSMRRYLVKLKNKMFLFDEILTGRFEKQIVVGVDDG